MATRIIRSGLRCANESQHAICECDIGGLQPFEQQDVFLSYGHGYFQRTEAVIAPVDETMADVEIIRK